MASDGHGRYVVTATLPGREAGEHKGKMMERFWVTMWILGVAAGDSIVEGLCFLIEKIF